MGEIKDGVMEGVISLAREEKRRTYVRTYHGCSTGGTVHRYALKWAAFWLSTRDTQAVY